MGDPWVLSLGGKGGHCVFTEGVKFPPLTLTRSPPLTWLSKFPYVSGDRESEVSLVMSWRKGRGQWENTEMSWRLWGQPPKFLQSSLRILVFQNNPSPEAAPCVQQTGSPGPFSPQPPASLQSIWDPRSREGTEPRPWQWRHSLLTTGPPENS